VFWDDLRGRLNAVRVGPETLAVAGTPVELGIG
jgi:hypothetical protein